MISVDRQVRETTREQTSGAITRGPRCPRTQQWLPEATSSHEHELSPPQRAICETHDPTPQAFRTQAAHQVLRDPWSTAAGTLESCVPSYARADGGSKYWAWVASESGSRGQLSSLCSSAATVSPRANGARTCSWYGGSGPHAGVPLGLLVRHGPTSLSKPCGPHVRNTQAVAILSVSPHGHLSPG